MVTRHYYKFRSCARVDLLVHPRAISTYIGDASPRVTNEVGVKKKNSLFLVGVFDIRSILKMNVAAIVNRTERAPCLAPLRAAPFRGRGQRTDAALRGPDGSRRLDRGCPAS